MILKQTVHSSVTPTLRRVVNIVLKNYRCVFVAAIAFL